MELKKSLVSVISKSGRCLPGSLMNLFLGLVILIVSSPVTFTGKGIFQNWDTTLFGEINHLTLGFLGTILILIMQFGSSAGVFLAIVTALVFRKYLLARNFALGGVFTAIAIFVTKSLVDRGRPQDFMNNIIFRGGYPTGLGFPSGHAATAAFLASLLSPYLTLRQRYITWVIVALVGFARVYAGAHFPTDVVGGFALGIICGSVTNLVLGVPMKSFSHQ